MLTLFIADSMLEPDDRGGSTAPPTQETLRIDTLFDANTLTRRGTVSGFASAGMTAGASSNTLASGATESVLGGPSIDEQAARVAAMAAAVKDWRVVGVQGHFALDLLFRQGFRYGQIRKPTDKDGFTHF